MCVHILGPGTLTKASKGMKKGQTHTGKLGSDGNMLTQMEDTYYLQQPGTSAYLLGTAEEGRLVVSVGGICK